MRKDLSFLTSAIPQLQPLLEEVLFIGGAIVPLYITDPSILYVRPTLDIDILTAATTYTAYQATVDKLLALGFSHDISGPICRFVKAQLIVDLMSAEEAVLGFSNRWYRQALATSQLFLLPNGLGIRIPTAPLMLATKLDAYDSRGKSDPAISKDLDDIVSLIDGRAELGAEIRQSDADLQNFIATSLHEIVHHKIVRHILPGLFLGPDAASRHDRFHQRVSSMNIK